MLRFQLKSQRLTQTFVSLDHKTSHKGQCFEIEIYLGFPVAQMVEHGASNTKIMGSIPRESKSWSKVKKTVT